MICHSNKCQQVLRFFPWSCIARSGVGILPGAHGVVVLHADAKLYHFGMALGFLDACEACWCVYWGGMGFS